MVDFLKVISSRHCTRAFHKNKQIDDQAIERILHAASNAPSSQNNQPWRCMVLSGSSRNNLSASLLAAFDEDERKTPDYKNRAEKLSEEQKRGIDEYGKFHYSALDREDLKGRKMLYRRNYEFYDAPTVIILSTFEGAVEGTFLDLGCFLQNILLGCAAMGLGAIPQFSVASYSHVIKKEISALQEQLIVCAISVGWPLEQETSGPLRNLDFIQWKK